MVGYPVGIGVGAEDLTYAVAELEPGFEFSKMLRWRTYGILVNDLRTFSVQCDQGRWTFGTSLSFPPTKVRNLLLHWPG